MFCLYLYLLYIWRAGAVATNRTIDDTLGDIITGNRPVYLPPTPGVWEDATCKTCAIQPDKNKAFKGTWNAATYNPGLKSMSVGLSFKGTAIYVFFILANNAGPGITSETACNFTLDGSPAGSFSHTPSASPDLEYDVLVYSTSNLPNINHQFLISTSGLDRSIFVNFDYAIYTVDDAPTLTLPSTITSKVLSTTTVRSTPAGTTIQGSQASGGSSKSKTPVGAIVGGVIGGIVVLLALILTLLFCRQRKRKLAIIDHSPSNLMAPPHFHSKGSNAPFITITPAVPKSHARPYTHSDFLQSGTDVERNSDLYNDRSHNNPPNTTLSQDHTMTSHSFLTTSSTGETIMPVNTEHSSSRRALPLLPVNHPEHNTEAVRRARQLELDHQVRVVKREMRDLKRGMDSETVRYPSIRSQRPQSAEIARMKEQIRMMGQQIEFLRAQRQSEWAQGLSDAPPPGYSPT